MKSATAVSFASELTMSESPCQRTYSQSLIINAAILSILTVRHPVIARHFNNDVDFVTYLITSTDNGIDIEAPFTDVYTKGAHSQNISLSDEAFQLLAPLSEKELFPVVWKL